MIRKNADKDSVILIQNAFPTIEKYVKNKHTIDGIYVKISSALKREIIDDFKYVLSLKIEGRNLFFTDIDRIKEIMLEELNNK